MQFRSNGAEAIIVEVLFMSCSVNLLEMVQIQPLPNVRGANTGFDATAEEFPPTVLPRIGGGFYSTRRSDWRMDLPQ
jgi:hypothetical protein